MPLPLIEGLGGAGGSATPIQKTLAPVWVGHAWRLSGWIPTKKFVGIVPTETVDLVGTS